jgi:hypothetical protein
MNTQQYTVVSGSGIFGAVVILFWNAFECSGNECSGNDQQQHRAWHCFIQQA